LTTKKTKLVSMKLENFLILEEEDL